MKRIAKIFLVGLLLLSLSASVFAAEEVNSSKDSKAAVSSEETNLEQQAQIEKQLSDLQKVIEKKSGKTERKQTPIELNDSAIPMVPQPVAPQPVAPQPQETFVTITEEQPRYDFDCQNVRVADAVWMIAKRAGKGISINTELKGTVMTSLSQKTFSEAMDILSKNFNFNWMLEGDTILVSPSDVMLQNKRFSVKYANTKLIKDDLVALSIPEKNISINPEYNTVTVLGTPYTLGVAEKRIAEMDRPVSQILIVAKMLEVSKGDSLDFGIKYTMPTFEQTVSSSSSGMRHDWTMNYSVASNANKALNSGKIIAKPLVMTLNGMEANVAMVDRVPVQKSTTSSTTTDITVSYEEVGNTLKVIPVANEANDEITLNVQAKVSSISKWLTIGNISAPQISSREAKTIAHLHSGETMVIGGLMNSSDMDNLSGIPGLMNLPILGNLFKFHSKSHNDSEIVITVTPYLVKGDMDVRTILRNN